MSASASHNFNVLALFRTALHKPYNTVALGKQGMVPAATDIHTGMEMRTTLAYQYVACQYGFTAVALYTQSFRF